MAKKAKKAKRIKIATKKRPDVDSTLRLHRPLRRDVDQLRLDLNALERRLQRVEVRAFAEGETDKAPPTPDTLS
jgi:hypothetical protein